jgi:hypothetical protein
MPSASIGITGASGAADHHEGYARAKSAVPPLGAAILSKLVRVIENIKRETA